ncbi:MAG TPA: two-component regulator propeller domain-containing protein [Kofleriaceae bacterium]|nr:two-component regulator propeller domain-containing protein [Kofleriaceae bacterium]
MSFRCPRLGLLGVLLAIAGCPPPEPETPPIPPVATGKVRVRVFTEPAPVKSVGVVGKSVFVATDDAIERWDGSSVFALSADHGLPGERIVAIAPDPERRRLWILSDGGLGSYDTAAQLYTEVAAPPPALAIDYAAIAKDGLASLAPATEGGVWLGTAKGLVFVSDRGGWLPTPIKDPVRALLRDREGWLWIATKGGLLALRPSGDAVRFGPPQGCEVVDPRLIVDAPGDRVMVIGADEQGHDRIAIGKQNAWASYRTLPEVTWDAATRRGNAIVTMGGGRVYRIALATDGAVRPLARDGMRLVPLAASGASEWVIDPIDVVLPPGATTLGSADDQLLIGTRDLGTARYREGDPRPLDWLRRKQMFADATTLSVACARPTDCWIATGARQAWHWNGERFTAGGPDQVVLAVARDPAGPIYALHRAIAEKEIHLSRIDGGSWVGLPRIELATPGDAPEISFARFAASGSLWVGLRYRDGNERRSYGIAIVEPATGKVAYHRTESPGDEKKTPKMLPIPVGVVDADVRGDTAWFATNEGVVRLADGQVRLWTEADGLRSELARAVTIASDGAVIVATGAGAGVWDGKTWDFPAALRFEINDVVATRNGQVWMATERGIAAWDGKKVRRVDTRRGLAENEVLDVAVDQFDRVWARGPGSLTLVSQ